MSKPVLNIPDDATEAQYRSALGYARVTSFATLIDVESYIEEHGLFITRDLRIGRMFRIRPMSQEVLNDYQKQAAAEAMSRVLNGLPEGLVGQFLVYNHTDVRDSLTRFTENAVHEGASQKIADSIARTQKKGASFGFFSDLTPQQIDQAQEEYATELRDELAEHSDIDDADVVSHIGGVERGAFALTTEIYLTITLEPEWRNKGLLRHITDIFRVAKNTEDGQRLALSQFEKEALPFKTVLSTIEQRLAGEGFDTFSCNKQDMVDLLFRVMNPDRIERHAAPEVGGGCTVAEALTESFEHIDISIANDSTATPVELNPNGWRIGKTHYAVTSVTRQPENTFPNMIGEAMARAEGPGWQCVNFSVMKQSKIRTVLKMRRGLISTAKKIGEKVPILAPDEMEMQKREDSLALATNATNLEELDTQLVVEASFHVVCMSRNKQDALSRARKLETLLWNAGFREQLRGDAMVHNTLPFQNRKTSDHVLGRAMPILTVNMCDLVNMYAGYEGVSDGRLLFNNANGAPTFIDQFTSETTAPHALLVGGTGTGKSFLMNNLMTRMYAQYKPKGFILDKGRSYESMILGLGGEYVVLVPDDMHGYSPRCFNPFYLSDGKDATEARKPTPNEVESMRATLIAMLKAGTTDEKGVSETIDKEQQTYLMAKITEFFKTRELGKELTMTGFAMLLRNDNEMGQSIATRLSEYWGDGIYARMFDGPLDIDFSAQLVGIELEYMAESSALDVLLLAIFNIIESTVKHDLPQSQKKFLAIDEAHKVLAKDYLASRVGGFYRELRKFNCPITLISQQLADFAGLVKAEGKAADGILANTQHLYFLGVNSQDMALAAELFNLSEDEAAAWTQSKSLPPFFSEFFYILRHKSNRNKSGLVRLYSDPFSLILCSTHPADIDLRKNRIKELMDSGQDKQAAVIQAVDEISKQYPYGVNYGSK